MTIVVINDIDTNTEAALVLLCIILLVNVFIRLLRSLFCPYLKSIHLLVLVKTWSGGGATRINVQCPIDRLQSGPCFMDSSFPYGALQFQSALIPLPFICFS